MRVRLLSLCVVAGLVMLAAAQAHADWRTDVSIPERPNDVLEVWGPERFSVGYPQGAYLFVDGGVARKILGDSSTESAGTYYQPVQDCFISVDKVLGVPQGLRVSDGAPCGSFNVGDPIIPSGTPVRVKHAANGGAVAVARDVSEYAFYLSQTSIYGPIAFNPVSASMVNLNDPIGVVQVGGKVYALLATAVNTATVYWVDSSDLSIAMSMRPTTSDVGRVLAIDMFSAGNPAKPYAVVGTQSGLLQGSNQASQDPIKPVQMLDGGVSSVSMNVGFGGDAGQGFGMAIVELPDGGYQVVSPVPMLADTEAGTVWQNRSLPASIASAPLEQVACTGASYCVLTASRAGGGNIFIYTNDAGPELSVTAPGALVVDTGTDASVTFDEGRTYQLTFAAQDPDGDPVLVNALPTSQPSGAWTWVPDAGYRPGDPVVWDVTTSAICESQELGTFKVSASDGLALHEAYGNVQLRVNHTRAPEQPSVMLSDGGVQGGGPVGELVAGGLPLTLRLAGNGTTAVGCRLHPQWEPLFTGTGVPSLEQDGGTAIITPPDTFCSQTPGSFDFRLRVTDDGGLSNSSVFNVQLQPGLTPFSDGELMLDAGPQPPDVLRVDVTSDLNCPESRGLRADLWLEPPDGGERVQSATVPIPGTWEASLAAGCGRPLLLKGVMEDDAGQRSTEVVQQVVTSRVETGLEAMPEESALIARCGEPARITLTQTFPPSACQTPDVIWTQESGPPLEQAVLSGQTVSLVTRDTGLDALVGESLVMRVTASAGPDNETSRLVTLPITVEPFVKVRRRTEVPAASETGLVGVSVDLLNTTACDVRDVSYVERLEGLTYVEGSAKFDGQPVEATWSEGALTVTGLDLAGEGSGRLTYVARPHLVGERRMEGEARLRNAVISLSDKPGPQVPDSGCGCSGSGPGPVLFALGALVAAVRRRRR